MANEMRTNHGHHQRHDQLHAHQDGATRARSFDDVLKEAQEMGYAEADPTSDVEGHDAAYKLAILASPWPLRRRSPSTKCNRGGITKVTPEDMAYADELGYVIKLLAIAKAHRRGRRGEGASDDDPQGASPGGRQRRV